jgi:crossover junction endodeoxyribonuclease RuvC
MRIIGIDPGTLVTGYGIIETNGVKVRYVGGGCIRNSGKTRMQHRFKKIYEELCEVFEKYRPEHMAVEGLFFCKNVKSAIKLGEARGIAMLAAAVAGAETFEYAPRRVKQAIIGRGGGRKDQVGYMLRTILNLNEFPEPHDMSDALAIAVCHAFSIRRTL